MVMKNSNETAFFFQTQQDRQTCEFIETSSMHMTILHKRKSDKNLSTEERDVELKPQSYPGSYLQFISAEEGESVFSKGVSLNKTIILQARPDAQE